MAVPTRALVKALSLHLSKRGSMSLFKITFVALMLAGSAQAETSVVAHPIL
jgi:hypothetical protein